MLKVCIFSKTSPATINRSNNQPEQQSTGATINWSNNQLEQQSTGVTINRRSTRATINSHQDGMVMTIA